MGREYQRLGWGDGVGWVGEEGRRARGREEEGRQEAGTAGGGMGGGLVDPSGRTPPGAGAAALRPCRWRRWRRRRQWRWGGCRAAPWRPAPRLGRRPRWTAAARAVRGGCLWGGHLPSPRRPRLPAMHPPPPPPTSPSRPRHPNPVPSSPRPASSALLSPPSSRDAPHSPPTTILRRFLATLQVRPPPRRRRRRRHLKGCLQRVVEEPPATRLHDRRRHNRPGGRRRRGTGSRCGSGRRVGDGLRRCDAGPGGGAVEGVEGQRPQDTVVGPGRVSEDPARSPAIESGPDSGSPLQDERLLRARPARRGCGRGGAGERWRRTTARARARAGGCTWRGATGRRSGLAPPASRTRSMATPPPTGSGVRPRSPHPLRLPRRGRRPRPGGASPPSWR